MTKQQTAKLIELDSKLLEYTNQLWITLLTVVAFFVLSLIESYFFSSEDLI